jgi:hypothetical protein
VSWPVSALIAGVAAVGVAAAGRFSGGLSIGCGLIALCSHSGSSAIGVIFSGLLLGSGAELVAGRRADRVRRARAIAVLAALLLAPLPLASPLAGMANGLLAGTTAMLGGLLVAATWMALLPRLSSSVAVAGLGAALIAVTAGGLLPTALDLSPPSPWHPSGAAWHLPKTLPPVAAVPAWISKADLILSIAACAVVLAVPWLRGRRPRGWAAGILVVMALVASALWWHSGSVTDGSVAQARMLWAVFRLGGTGVLIACLDSADGEATPQAAADAHAAAARWPSLVALALAAGLGLMWAVSAPHWTGPLWPHDPAAFALAAIVLACAATLASERPLWATVAAAWAWYAAVTLAGGASAGLRVAGALD